MILKTVFIAEYCCMCNLYVISTSFPSNIYKLYLKDWKSCQGHTIFPDVCRDVGDVHVFDVQLPEVGELPELNRKFLDTWITAETGRIKIKLLKSKQNIITSCEFLKQEGEKNMSFWYCTLVWLGTLDFHPHCENPESPTVILGLRSKN